MLQFISDMAKYCKYASLCLGWSVMNNVWGLRWAAALGVRLVAQGVSLKGQSPEMLFILFGTDSLTLLCKGCEEWLQVSWHPVVSGKEDTTAYLPLSAWDNVAVE